MRPHFSHLCQISMLQIGRRGVYNPYFYNSDSNLSRIPVLFAFSSDLKSNSEKEIERFMAVDDKFFTNPVITVICIVGRGYWYFSKQKNNWINFKPDSQHSEVINFIGGVSNTLSMMYYSRNPAKLGMYLINEDNSPIEISTK